MNILKGIVWIWVVLAVCWIGYVIFGWIVAGAVAMMNLLILVLLVGLVWVNVSHLLGGYYDD